MCINLPFNSIGKSKMSASQLSVENEDDEGKNMNIN